MRNVGVCLPIASNYFAGTDVAIPILAFSGIMIPMNMVLAVVAGRMLGGKEEIAGATKA
jgi:predicted Na+-dependent transporter